MATEPSHLDAAERIARLVREVMILLVCVYLAWYLVPLLPKFADQLKRSELTDVDLGVIKLKLQQAEGALETVVRTQAPEKGNVDERVSEQVKLVAQAPDTVRSAAQPIRQAETAPAAAPATGAVIPTPRAAPAPVPTAASTAAYWVYIGAYKDGRWLTKYFDISGAAHVGDTLRASAAIFRRQSAPAVVNEEWLLGTPMGVLQAGERVRVLRLQSVPGTGERELVWAEVAPQ